jgi:hypothetical protein
MRCWNCGKKIPKKAKACQFCEAAVDAAPTEEEKEILRDLLQQMPAEAIEEFESVIEESDTAEEFVNRIMVGDCPRCGSAETGHCEDDPEIGELLVGRCYQCGQLWCTECLRLLDRASPRCDCWDEE